MRFAVLAICLCSLRRTGVAPTILMFCLRPGDGCADSNAPTKPSKTDRAAEKLDVPCGATMSLCEEGVFDLGDCDLAAVFGPAQVRVSSRTSAREDVPGSDAREARERLEELRRQRRQLEEQLHAEVAAYKDLVFTGKPSPQLNAAKEEAWLVVSNIALALRSVDQSIKSLEKRLG